LRQAPGIVLGKPKTCGKDHGSRSVFIVAGGWDGISTMAADTDQIVLARVLRVCGVR